MNDTGLRHKHELEMDNLGLRHKHELDLHGQKQVSGRTGDVPATSANFVSDYAQIILDHHDIHRANHSAPALTWSDHLAKTAQEIGETCVYAHNTTASGGGHGQNIAAAPGPDHVGALLTRLMYYAEIGGFPLPYGQPQPDVSNVHAWGHFSQIVWKSTTSVGCATVDCSASGLAETGPGVPRWLTVCHYDPPGNVDGQYGENVAEPKGVRVLVVDGPEF